jgi:glucosamine--fructose-6-phosphate aminotransferase (isomerizing)
MLTQTNLYREIFEQPDVVARVVSQERTQAERLADAMRQSNVDHVVIAARGTSDNAGRYAKYVLGAHCGLQVALATPSLFTQYARPPRFGNALVLGISQSGQSPDIVAVLAEAKKQNKLTAVITNATASPLAAQGDFVFDLHAGEEKAVAATKTYTGSLAAVALLAAAIAGDATLHTALAHVPAAMADTLALDGAVAAAAPRYRYMEQSVVIGRGFNYATAFELALKLKELTYTIVEPYSSADFLHGPLAMVSSGYPVLVLAPAGGVHNELRAFMQTLRQQGAELLVISDQAETVALGKTSFLLPTAVPEWLSPLLTILPGQLLALHLAHERGFDVDAPRAIHKVTLTS